MATHALSRRGFLGHVAGAYAATALVAGTASAVTLETVIGRHRAADRALSDACLAKDEDPCRATEQAVETASNMELAAKQALLRYRPLDMDEAARRFAYLVGDDGPWRWFLIEPEDIMTIAESMMTA